MPVRPVTVRRLNQAKRRPVKILTLGAEQSRLTKLYVSKLYVSAGNFEPARLQQSLNEDLSSSSAYT